MSKKPNILLVMTDQQRLDTIQKVFSNFDAKTPTMDFLAKEGVVFDNCFCTAPICSPSRATIMTGLTPSQSGMPGNLYGPCPPMSLMLPTMGNMFRNAGYETVYNGKWHLGGDVKDYGFEKGEESSYDEHTRIEASRFVRDRDWVANERPFLQVVSFLNPHDLYFYDPEKKVPNKKRPWKNINYDQSDLPEAIKSKIANFPEEQWGSYLEFYEEQLEIVDNEMKLFLDQFKSSGFYNNSWIIFTTDHGDMAGEHNLPFKGSYMYDGVVRVPMIIVPPMTRFAGADRGQNFKHDIKPFTSNAQCSLIDLLPTMLDIAGIDKPDNLDGKSLLPVVKGENSEDLHETVFAEWHKPAIRMARTRDWKYVNFLNTDEQLFDLKNDPHETKNLASDENYRKEKEDMLKRLNDHIKKTDDPFYNLDQHEFIFNPSKNEVTSSKPVMGTA